LSANLNSFLGSDDKKTCIELKKYTKTSEDSRSVRGHDRMVVGFITSYAINAFHN